VRVLPPLQILARLERSLSLLAGERGRPERQRTLRGAISWSYDLLEEPERKLFARMSVFSGGSNLDAIDAVGNPEGDLGVDAVDCVTSLVDKSLVRQTETPDGDVRFGMLETIRAYAAERLAAEFDEERTELRHAQHFASLAREAGPTFESDPAAAIHLVGADLDNVRGVMERALRSGRSDLPFRTAGALWRVWLDRGRVEEARRAIEGLLSRPPETPEGFAQGLLVGGHLAYWQTDYASAEHHYERALDAYRSMEDLRGEVEALLDLGYVALARRDLARGVGFSEEAQARANDLGDRRWLAESASVLAIARMQQGDMEGAISATLDAQRGFQAVGRIMQSIEMTGRVGGIYWRMGDLDRAESLTKETFGEYRDRLPTPGVLVSLDSLSVIASRRGDHERALRLGGAADRVREEMAARPPAAFLEFQDVRASARAALDDALVDRLWDEGRSMGREEAIDYALQEPGPNASADS
jgi:tetratricopeptide (TPR) repeat protein